MTDPIELLARDLLATLGERKPHPADRLKAMDLVRDCSEEQRLVPPALLELLEFLLVGPALREAELKEKLDRRADRFAQRDTPIELAKQFEASMPPDPTGQRPSQASDRAINKAIAKKGRDLRRSIRRWHGDRHWFFTSYGSYRDSYRAWVEYFRRRPRRGAPTATWPVPMPRAEFDRWVARLKMLGVDWFQFLGLPHLTFERLEALARLGIKSRDDLAANNVQQTLAHLPPALRLSAEEQKELLAAYPLGASRK